MFILVDDEDRENEGDLVIPAQIATPEAINFMAKHGARPDLPGADRRARRAARPAADGAATTARATRPPSPSRSRRAKASPPASPPPTARTPSRSRSIRTKGRERHRHARPCLPAGGARRRRAGARRPYRGGGRYRAARRAEPVGRDLRDHERRRHDGAAADLIAFAQLHGLKIGTIADLIAYRRRNEQIVERASSSAVQSRYGGECACIVYRNKVTYAEHIALVKGDITDAGAGAGAHACDQHRSTTCWAARRRGGELRASMRMIAKEGRGVIVLIRDTGRPALSERVRAWSAASRAAHGRCAITASARRS